jgi:hypothetical protein
MFLHTIMKDANIAGLQDLKRIKLVIKNTHWDTWSVLAERRQVLDCAEGSMEWRKETFNDGQHVTGSSVVVNVG